MSTSPAVSIIISAYNRPQVIPFAIRSVLGSDFADWELLVIGDGCSDATVDAVRAFADPRIQFFNLPANTGSQSEPHNEGVRRARGKYVLFLNQDDMYFPDHIARQVAFLESSGADIAWSPVLLLQHSASDAGPVDPDRDRIVLDGVVSGDSFDPRSFVISSSWAVRRDACLAVGPWLSPEETRLSPSQEWLYRASRQGRRLAFHRYASVLCIHSGVRRYAYLTPRSPEHERAWSWIEAGAAERVNLLNCAAVQSAAEAWRLQRVSRGWRAIADTVLARVGVHPHSAERFFKRMSKGEWVGNHRTFTILPPQAPVGQQIELGTASADIYCGKGWHQGETIGRWTGGAEAEIFFDAGASAGGGRTLTLSGHPLRTQERVVFAVNDQLEERIFDAGKDTLVRLPLPPSGPYRLTISVDKPSTPSAIHDSADTRTLGFRLSWMRVDDEAAED
jgi:GT2 family glycosyltransferase